MQTTCKQTELLGCAYDFSRKADKKLGKVIFFLNKKMPVKRLSSKNILQHFS
jgi:hypothetical protein